MQMTALERYARLEATGTWREHPGAAPRAVGVRFGNATLVIADAENAPLSHWALAGIQKIAGRGGSALYSTTDDASETLELHDRDMIEAIEAVALGAFDPGSTAPVHHAAHRQRVLRPLFGLAVLAALVLAAGALGPPAIRDLAVRMVPAEQAEEFGERMLLTLMRGDGRICQEYPGTRVLGDLAAKAQFHPPAQALVLDRLPVPVATLPGPKVVVQRARIGTAETPDSLIGWLALGAARAPLADLMDSVGLVGQVRYILTGTLRLADLEAGAGAAVRAPGTREASAALARLRDADLSGDEFAAQLREMGLDPAGAAPAPAQAPMPLPDQDWVALKGICG